MRVVGERAALSPEQSIPVLGAFLAWLAVTACAADRIRQMWL
jgi:hypothetical protein